MVSLFSFSLIISIIWLYLLLIQLILLFVQFSITCSTLVEAATVSNEDKTTKNNDNNNNATIDNNGSSFHRKQQQQQQQHYLLHHDGVNLIGQNSHDLYGWSTSFSGNGNIFAISAIDHDPYYNISAAGQVYIYKNKNKYINNNNTTMVKDDQNNDDDHNDDIELIGILSGQQISEYMGYSISLNYDGTIIAIGSPGYNSNSGKLSIYEYMYHDDSNIEKKKSWIVKGQQDYIDLHSYFNMNCCNSGNNNTDSTCTTQQQKQKHEEEVEGSGFGHVVALSNDGDTVVVGAPYYDHNRGLVLILQFNKEQNSWISTSNNCNNNNACHYYYCDILLGDMEGAQFGYSIAISSDTNIVVVGAKNHPGKQQQQQKKSDLNKQWYRYNKGQVQIYQRQQRPKQQKEQSLLIVKNDNNNHNSEDNYQQWILAAPPIYGIKNGDYFGFALSISANGKIIAVGSPYYDDGDDAKNGNNNDNIVAKRRDVGRVQIYYLLATSDDDPILEQQQQQQCYQQQQDEQEEDNTCTYDNNDNSKKQLSFDYECISLGIPIEGINANDFFGYSISLSNTGRRIAIGAKQANELRGQVYIYDFVNGSYWQQFHDIIINGEDEKDQSGFSISLAAADGKFLLIGSPYHTTMYMEEETGEAASKKEAATVTPKNNNKTMKKMNAGQARIFVLPI